MFDQDAIRTLYRFCFGDRTLGQLWRASHDLAFHIGATKCPVSLAGTTRFTSQHPHVEEDFSCASGHKFYSQQALADSIDFFQRNGGTELLLTPSISPSSHPLRKPPQVLFRQLFEKVRKAPVRSRASTDRS
jgi:hypothetical protein